MFSVVVPSSRERSARSSACCCDDLGFPEAVVVETGAEGIGRRVDVDGGWEKTSKCVTPRGPDMDTKSLSLLALRSCKDGESVPEQRE